MCAFTDLGGVENDVVMVEVKAEWDVEFFANREGIVDRPGNIVIFEDETLFDRW